MSEYWQETAGTLKEVTGESLIKGLWTKLGQVQGKKIRDGEAPQDLQYWKPLPSLDFKGPGEVEANTDR